VDTETATEPRAAGRRGRAAGRRSRAAGSWRPRSGRRLRVTDHTRSSRDRTTATRLSVDSRARVGCEASGSESRPQVPGSSESVSTASAGTHERPHRDRSPHPRHTPPQPIRSARASATHRNRGPHSTHPSHERTRPRTAARPPRADRTRHEPHPLRTALFRGPPVPTRFRPGRRSPRSRSARSHRVAGRCPGGRERVISDRRLSVA
jgi:hypothetical protein